MIAYVKNGVIMENPQMAPKVWTEPETGKTYSGFDNLPLKKIFKLGWKEVIDEPIEYNSYFEILEKTDWYYDSEKDIVTRDYIRKEKSISDIKENIFDKLDETLKTIQNLGYKWGKKNIVVLLDSDFLTKLNMEYIAIKNNIKNGENNLLIINSIPMYLSSDEIIELWENIRNYFQHIYRVYSDFWNEIKKSETIDELKHIIIEIEDKNNWI